ncbi:MAG TPA: mannose-1-phosphate guanylyltransferase/mannose-6-phosphate isomerase [Desulfobacterales bacterium]|nr:mannose-1-phosphate guanylyltransferase/mannose-6-phosphate isomerase [Desulfobacterales bacterium]
MKKLSNVYPVLLAGGSGTRLWPVSRERHPKQLVKFIGKDSLVQSTVKRLTSFLDMENIRIVCGKEHVHEIARQMKEIDISADEKIIAEPCARNTAPAILLAMFHILKKEADAVLCIFPADHVIRDQKAFQDKLVSAVKVAEMGHIVTFGIKPHYPETGYGYIEGAGEIGDGALSVKRFVEKPDLETAKKYIDAGNFFWNSGMFTFKASVMAQELSVHQPELLKKMMQLPFQGTSPSQKAYEQLPNISIDYAVMEKTDKAAVLPSDFGWSDIGSWKSLYDFMAKDINGNVVDGDVILKETSNCLIMGHERLIATSGIENMVVVETPDAVFVSDMENSRDVKSIVEKLKEDRRTEHQTHKTVHHPWGISTTLEKNDDFSVVQVELYPGSKLEIKTGSSTVEHLVVAKGLAKTTTDHQRRALKKGQSLMLSGNQTILMENPGKDSLVIVKVKSHQ